MDIILLNIFNRLTLVAPALSTYLLIGHMTGAVILGYEQLHKQSPEPQLSAVHYTDTRPARNVICSSGA